MYIIQKAGPSWERRRIAAEGASLRIEPCEVEANRRVAIDPVSTASRSAQLVPFEESGAQRVALPCDPADVWISGRQPLGVTVLEERAEILFLGVRLYFSGREPLEARPLSGGALPGEAVGAESRCAVCDEALAEGALAIECTNCSTRTHEECFAEQGFRCRGCALHRSDFQWVHEDSGEREA
jgi:hypothetical protein